MLTRGAAQSCSFNFPHRGASVAASRPWLRARLAHKTSWGARPVWKRQYRSNYNQRSLFRTTSLSRGARRPEKGLGGEKERLQSAVNKEGKHPASRPAKVQDRGPISWKSVAFLAVAAAGLVGYYQFMMQKRQSVLPPPSLSPPSPTSASPVAEKKASKPRSIGTPDIGGPFTLVDHNGVPVTDATFRGKYMLLYFGFTFCPDICPAELDKITMALENLVEKQGVPDGAVIPVFVSLDPWRDSVAKIRQYIKDFHPNMVGLTGTPEQVNSMASAYRVYSASSKKDKYGEDQDYLVDHSVYAYLIGPKGEFVNYYGSDYSVEKMARAIAEVIRAQENETVQNESILGWAKNLFVSDVKES